ncbi:MAG TPA: biotin/lipoate A/B protein ligase family protein [Pirellulales bacterium]|nr:biotin/lipoate A/B protein ligase family protein [Pirellulales bacterium]
MNHASARPRDDRIACRLLVDRPSGGAWNMAVDELLADDAAAQGRWNLRLYQWERPTLSLGYFQRAGDRAAHPASAACPLVRRPSGGGAIVHDRELTYCLAVCEQHPLAADAARLYRAVHQSLVEALAGLGIPAELNETASTAPAAEPFLCFQRRSAGDVLVLGHKVIGSAQRRRRGAILQHGSILLAASPAAPELPGIGDLAGRPITPAQIRSAWLNLFKQRLGVRLLCSELAASEVAAARRIEAEKFARDDWTLRR